MLHKMHQHARSERGFTLIELLVVILIIGVLAAIAIPSFLAQKAKANDASAKELARTAQTTAETVANDNNGSYAALTAVPATGAAVLAGVEPTIDLSSTNGTAFLNSAVTPAPTSYPGIAGNTVAGASFQVTVTSVPTLNTFTITKNSDGTVVRTCTAASTANKGGCPNSGLANNNTW